ncbi:MAG TPA: hypothetical protein VH639_18105 [Bryobacteraceae bacterium]
MPRRFRMTENRNQCALRAGSQGASTDNGAIRIGTPGPPTPFSVPESAAPPQATTTAVVIDSNGQLGGR